MHPYDVQAQLQLARERADRLAQDYDRARQAPADESASRRRRAPALVHALRALRPSRRPARA